MVQREVEWALGCLFTFPHSVSLQIYMSHCVDYRQTLPKLNECGRVSFPEKKKYIITLFLPIMFGIIFSIFWTYNQVI